MCGWASPQLRKQCVTQHYEAVQAGEVGQTLRQQLTGGTGV